MNNTDYPCRFIDRFSSDYPKKLQDIKDPPGGIYVKGSLPDPKMPCVAIVGSRICSQYGRLAASEFGAALSKCGVQIISGLARGIDGISQLAACENGGKSFGVLGCGINVIYPSQNKHIYNQVLATGGGLISETAPDAPPIGRQFASRNRIISALSDIVLVIEAKEKSGTQITVSRALEQGKDVYALPGRIFDICSQGCNDLIHQGAGIACSPDVILEALGINTTPLNNSLATPGISLEPLELRVYKALDFYPQSVDLLSKNIQMPIPELLNILFHLQLKEFATNPSSGYYCKAK